MPQNYKKKWFSQHIKDPYVVKAKKDNYRSRSAYKLIELQNKYKLFKSNMNIVELGSAPGGWSQVLSNIIGQHGKIFGLDIISMEPIKNMMFINEDFTKNETRLKLLSLIDKIDIDWVVSDMAPNITGNKHIDQNNVFNLVSLALDFSDKILKKNSNFLSKVFQGIELQPLISLFNKKFKKIIIKKPNASRKQSKELYIIGFNKM